MKATGRILADCKTKLQHSVFAANAGKCEALVGQQSTSYIMTTPVFNINKKSQSHKYSHHIHLDKDRKINMPNLITSLSQAYKHVEYSTLKK